MYSQILEYFPDFKMMNIFNLIVMKDYYTGTICIFITLKYS